MRYLVLTEAADHLRVAPGYLRKLAQSRLVPSYKPNGGRLLFLKDDLDAFIARGRQGSIHEQHAVAEAWVNRPVVQGAR